MEEVLIGIDLPAICSEPDYIRKKLSTIVEDGFNCVEISLDAVPLIINDRIDVALAVGAEGVHVGQDDMPYEAARAIMGPHAIIGLSVETWEDVEEAEKLDCDYLGVSPVFETPTKTDTKGAWGLEGLTKIKAYSRHRLVAIGGINMTNAAEAVRAGADCIAVVSAICAAPDPGMVSKQLVDIIMSHGSSPD